MTVEFNDEKGTLLTSTLQVGQLVRVIHFIFSRGVEGGGSELLLGVE